MKKLFTLGAVISLLISFTVGQNIAFELVLPQPPQTIADFEGIAHGSVAFADIDNDNDQDVLITGENNFEQPITKLYINDGDGNFFEVLETPFEAVLGSSIAFADVENDGDKDVFITGTNNIEERIAKLYTNDGDGHFTEATGTPFDGVSWGSIAFADIDNDDDQDLLITGLNNADERITKLYSNDGEGNFIDIMASSFVGVSGGSIAFGDTDNDNDQDLLITGSDNQNQRICKLYENDGYGYFTEVINTPFIGINLSSVAFADIDNDNDLDLLITGRVSSNISISYLYENIANGIYTLVMNTPFEGVNRSSVAFADIDDDNDNDVLITGQNSTYGNIAKLYTNDSNGVYTEVIGTSFYSMASGSIAFIDIDNDNDQDVLIAGNIAASSEEFRSILYTNDGNGVFEEVTGTPFEQVYNSATAFADIDNDNDQDMIITGVSTNSGGTAKLYTNGGMGIYTEITGIPFTGVGWSSLDFADIDNDNDQDVIIMGLIEMYVFPAILYRNDGNGNFTEVPDQPFEGDAKGTVSFADIDNDNDQDVLITGGAEWASLGTVELYVNDGYGFFTVVNGTPFHAVVNGHHAFADIDNDNDQDVLITGIHSGECIAKLYTNDGNGIFSELSGTPFTGVYLGSLAFADIDNDNDQDVLITGSDYYAEYLAKLYTNDGSGNFTEVLNTPFEGVYLSSVAFADLDNDGDEDLLITGENGVEQLTILYSNDGYGNFSEVLDTPFEGISGGSISFADIDNDDDRDVLLTGHNGTLPIAKLYRNITTTTGSIDKIRSQNSIKLYPNPSSGFSNLQFVISELGIVNCELFDISWVKIKSIINEKKMPGTFEMEIDLNDLPAGIYFYTLKTNDGIQTKKIIKL